MYSSLTFDVPLQPDSGERLRGKGEVGAITAGTARCRSSCHGPPTTRPCVSRPARLALVADQAEDRVQVVLARPQVTHWSFTSIHK